jgi:hypothetical protein
MTVSRSLGALVSIHVLLRVKPGVEFGAGVSLPQDDQTTAPLGGYIDALGSSGGS